MTKGLRKNLLRQIQSRTFAVVLMGLSIVASFLFDDGSSFLSFIEDQGLIFPFVTSGFVSSIWHSFNILLLVGLVLMFVVINRNFKLIRSNTWYFGAIFFLILLNFPGQMCVFSGATLLAVTVTIVTFLLFSTYGAQNPTYTILLIGLLLSAATFWVSCTAYFIPVIVIGMAQMRTLRLKTCIALAMGLIAPYWILWGFELSAPFEVFLPQSSLTLTTMFKTMPLPTLLALVLLILVSIWAIVATLYKSLSYNAGRRACHGFLTLLTLNFLIMIFVDTPFIGNYLTAFALLCAFQIAHAVAASGKESSTAPAVALPVLFMGLAVWNFLI